MSDDNDFNQLVDAEEMLEFRKEAKQSIASLSRWLRRVEQDQHQGDRSSLVASDLILFLLLTLADVVLVVVMLIFYLENIIVAFLSGPEGMEEQDWIEELLLYTI